MKKIIILFFVFSILGCSKSLDFKLEPEVEMFISNDLKQRIRLSESDEAYVVLRTWLNENRTRWYATSGRYSGGVYVKSGDYGIQVTESKVVIYSITGNEPKAIYIQEIEKNELSTLLNFTKKNK